MIRYDHREESEGSSIEHILAFKWSLFENVLDRKDPRPKGSSTGEILDQSDPRFNRIPEFEGSSIEEILKLENCALKEFYALTYEILFLSKLSFLFHMMLQIAFTRYWIVI